MNSERTIVWTDDMDAHIKKAAAFIGVDPGYIMTVTEGASADKEAIVYGGQDGSDNLFVVTVRIKDGVMVEIVGGPVNVGTLDDLLARDDL